MDERNAIPDPLPAGYTIQNRYVIERELPISVVGRVYKSHDSVLKESVALYVLSDKLRTVDGVRRFRRQFERAFRARKDVVYEYGEWHNVPFAVVALAEGMGASIDLSEY